MPLSIKDVEAIEKKQKEIHWKLLDFFDEHRGEYFTELEISERIKLPLLEFGHTLETMVIMEDCGNVKKKFVDGKIYFGKKVN